MKIVALIFSSLFLFSLNSYAQAEFRFHLQAYNLANPGIELAYQLPIASWTINETKQNILVLNAAPVLDFYNIRDNHSGIGATVEVNFQYKYADKFSLELYGGYGLLEAILSNSIYELNDNGTFDESSLKGNLYQNWKVGFGFTKPILLKREKDFKLHLRLGVRQSSTPSENIDLNLSGGINMLMNRKNN